jgi:oligopeptide/dipeptide ABC transporter ATP-binding protein
MLPVIEGSVPDLRDRGPGCAFAPRCPNAQEDCGLSVPALTGAAHGVACLHP